MLAFPTTYLNLLLYVSRITVTRTLFQVTIIVKGNKSIFAILTHKKNLNASLNKYGGVNI